MRENVNIIKKLVFSFFIILSLLTVCFVSCDNSINEGSDGNQNSRKGRVTFSVVQPKDKNARTVLPDSDVNKLTDVHLTGYSDTGYSYDETFTSVSALQSNYLEYDEGLWTFTLSAKLYGVVFTSSPQSKNITINSSSNITFTLSTTKTTGVFDFKLTFPENADKVTFSLNTYPGNSIVDDGEIPINAGTTNYIEYHDDALGQGTYRISLNFYKIYADATGNHDALINTYSEIINIRGGFKSSVERSIHLNALYTITYNYDPSTCNLVSGGTLPENYSIYSTPVTLGELEKTGYDFQGWYTGANGTGTKIERIPDLNPATRTLYAYLTAHEYTITYYNMTDAGYNAGESNPETYTIEDAVSLKNPVKTGYTFKGWFDKDQGVTGGTQQTGFAAGQTGIKKFYAHWQPNPTIEIIPGFPENYKCYYTMVEKSTGKEITIHVDNATTDTPATLETKQVSLYVSGTKIIDYDNLTFTYPKYIGEPDNNSFYVTFTIKKDDTTSYSYDYYPYRKYYGTKLPGEDLEVGDVIFSDGSASSYTETFSTEQKAAAVAIIFNAEKRLGAGLNVGTEKKWCQQNTDGQISSLAADENDGVKNTNEITGLSDYMPGNYPAFEYCKQYSVDGYSDGWYLPAFYELQPAVKTVAVRNAINSAFSALDKSQPFEAITNPPIYWTSTRDSNVMRARPTGVGADNNLNVSKVYGDGYGGGDAYAYHLSVIAFHKF